jgi:hypothetical protein
MSRFFLLLMLLSFSLASPAAECGPAGQEKFDKFFSRFTKEAAFAKQRTRYPLLVTMIERETHDIRSSSISPQEDEATPALNDFMRAHELGFAGVKLQKNAATVTVFRGEPLWRLSYLFRRDGGCWYLFELEDRVD